MSHPPIDPASPLPVHCDPKKEAAQKARWGVGPPPPVQEMAAAGTGVGEGEKGEKAAAAGTGQETKPGPAAHEEL